MVINSDAHDPFYVGEFSKVLSFLSGEEFEETLVINSNVEKLAEFLDVDLSRILPDMGR